MGILVSASEAAALVGRHERQVRWHITEKRDLPARRGDRGQWRINTDDLTRVPGWMVDRELLAKLEGRERRGYSGLVARTEAMEAHLRALETQLRAIERRLETLGRLRSSSPPPPDGPDAPDDPTPTPPDGPSGSDAPSDGLSGAGGALDWLSGPDGPVNAYPSAYRGPTTVTLLDRGPQTPQTFATSADAARWLGRHGINASTPKTWVGWKHVELTPRGALTFALGLQRVAERDNNWRVRWRLTRCGDAACVCQEALSGEDSAD